MNSFTKQSVTTVLNSRNRQQLKLPFMKKVLLPVMVAFVFIAGISGVKAQTLTFNFSGITTSATPLTATSAWDANLTLTNGITIGPAVTAAATSGRFSSTGYQVASLAAAVTGGNYIYFKITPNAGYNLSLSGKTVQFIGQVSGTGATNYALETSIDGFGTTTIGTSSSGGGGGGSSKTSSTITYTFGTGSQYSNITSTVEFRFYAWGATGSGGTFSLNSLSITEATAACAPVAPTSLSGTAGDTKSTVSWTNPSCFANVMVVAKNGTYTGATPSGSGYTANAALGSGTAFDGGSVIYYGSGNSVNLTGLTDGTTYNLEAFTQSVSGSWSAAATGIASPVACSSPTAVTGLGATPGNGQSVLLWTNPACYDNIMVVASSSSFTGATPSGTGYTANSASFTDGTNSTFDGGVVVYYGFGSGVTVTGLTNGTTYNFKVYTVKGSTWNGTATASASPYLPAYYWNGGTPTSGAATAAGGTGTWNTANAWVQPAATGTGATWADNNNAVFAGTAGTVTLSTSPTTTATYFNTPGYTLQLSAASTFTGPVNLNFNSGSAPYNLTIKPVTYTLTLPNGISSIGSNAGTVVLDGGSLTATGYSIISMSGAGQTISTPITVQSTGNTAGNGAVGIISKGVGNIISGNITNNLNDYLLLGGSTAGNSLIVNGHISSSSTANNYGLMYANSFAGGGAATLSLNNTNSYYGPTILNGGGSSGYVYLGNDGALPSTTDVIMGYTSGNGGYLDINGHNPTINSISSVFASATQGILNGASGTGTNTLTIAGSLTKTLSVPVNNGSTAKTALAITGSGTLILAEPGSFSGGLSVSGGGTFQVGVASLFTGSPALTLNNGIFATGAASGTNTGFTGTSTGGLTVGSGNGTISLGTGSHTLTIASSSANTWSGNLTINGWTRAANTANASSGKIIITGSGLTTTGTGNQLSKISFTGFSGHAIFNPAASTELIPDYVDGTTNTNFGTATYNPSSAPAVLSVAATCNSNAITGTATYQWYSSPNSNGSSPASLGSARGAQTASYTPSVTNGGSSPITTYYYCVVTYNGYTYTTPVSQAIIVNPAGAISVSGLSNSSNLTYVLNFGPSLAANFTINATYLTGSSITIDNGSSSALNYYELCTDSVAGTPGDWAGTASLSYTGGTITNAKVYVRLKAGLSANPYYTESYVSIYSGSANTSENSFFTGSVTSNTPPSITVEPSTTANTNCNTGTALSISVTAGSDNSPTYQWWYNTSASTLGASVLSSNATGSSYTPAITSQTVAGVAYYYYCEVSDIYNSHIYSDFSGANIINTPIASASVSIAADNTSICNGATVTYTATATTNGGTPTYQWYLSTDGGSSYNTTGTNSNVYTSSTLTDQNKVKVLLTPAGGCVTDASAVYSNIITETVRTIETPSVSVAGSSIACKSTSLTFTATPTATPNTYNVGGTGATYDWYKNSTKVVSAGTNTYTYTTGTSSTTDAVYAVLNTATGVCVTSNTATSNTISIAVSSAVPTITTTSTGVVLYPGFTSSFAATASGSGTLSYQWYNNGAAITNNTNNNNTATTATYTANANDLTNNGSVTCTVTSSLGCSATATGITVSVPTPTAFTSGNIVVERVGDGVTNEAAAAGRLFIDQFAPTGAGQSPISSSPLPYSVGTYSTGSSSSTNFSITTSANATSEGYMTLSADGKFLALPGYNAPLGTASIGSTATSAPSTNYRAGGVVYGSGVATVPLAADFQSGNNIRSLVSDGSAFWFSGASGFYYFSNLYDNTAKTYGSVNTRTLKIYNGSIYGSSSSGSNIGINFVDYLSNLGDNGTTAAMTLLTPTPNNPTNAYGFVLNPTGDVMYVADGTAGIIKYTYNGTVWSQAYVLNTTASLGLTGIFTGANPVLYATSYTGAPSKLFSVTDAGNPGTASATTSSYTLLSTSATTCVYKGVALAPSASQNSYIYANTAYRGNTFSGAFANTFPGTPTTTLTNTSDVNYFAIAGIFLNNTVTITPDAGFEVSLDESFSTIGTHSSPLSISAATLALTSTASTQLVYVRFNPATAATYSGNIVLTSSGASTVNIPVSGIAADLPNYYYTGTSGDLLSTNSWTSSSTLVGGTHPSAVQNAAGVSWNITIAGSKTLSAAWSLGAGSRIVIGDGTHSFNLTVPSAKAISGGSGISVANSSTLIWQDASYPIFSSLSAGSVVNYNGTVTQSITPASYSGLTLSSSGAKTFSGTYFVGNTFTAGTAIITTTGSTITFNGSAAQTVPGITYGALIISNTSGATLSGNAIITNNLTVSSGTLYVPVSKSLTVNGSSVSLSATGHLDVAGTFNNGTTAGTTCATFTQTTGSSVNFNYTTTVYNHNGNGGNIPSAIWNAASTCSVSGITTTNPTNASFIQNFGKFTWNNSGQTTALNINTSSFGTQGLLDIEATGSTYFALAGGLSNTYTNSINSITVNNAKFYTCVRTTSVLPTETLTVAGNINVSGTAVVDLADGYSTAATTYNTTLNAGGNIIVASTASLKASNKNGTVINGAKIIFTKSGAQTYTNASSTGNIDFIINSVSAVTLGSNVLQAATSTPTDYINNSGILNLNGYSLTCNNLNSATNVSTGLLVGNNGSLIINGATANTLNFRTTSSTDTLLGVLTLSGTGSITLGTGIGITDSLGLKNSSTNLNLNGHHLTLKSTSITNSAVVGVVTSGATVTGGNVTVERFIPEGLRQFRDLGPSVYNAGSVFNNWQENGAYPTNNGMFISGSYNKAYIAGSYNPVTGADYTTTGNPSLYTYINNVWAADTLTKATVLDPFQGMRALVRGARNFNLIQQFPNMVTATTLRATGQLVTGTVTFTTSGTSSTSGATSGYGLTDGANNWSLIANPYACPIDWASIWGHNTSNNITSSYSYLDPTFLSSGYSIYVTYNGASGVTNNAPSGTREFIQSGQGFFIQNDVSGTPRLVINETDKAPSSTHTSVFGNTKPNMLAITLNKNLNGSSSNIDGAVAVFNTNYTKSIGAEDSRKLMNPAENLYITESANELSIDGLPTPSLTDVVVLKLANVIAGETYQLNVDASQYAGLDAYIHDAYLNTDVSVTNPVTFTPTTDAATYANRFSIVFKANVVAVNNATKISVYPNPVTEKVFTIQTQNVAAGKYSVSMINAMGQTVMTTTINHAAGVSNETISMDRVLSSGMYTVVLKSADGKLYQSELLAK